MYSVSDCPSQGADLYYHNNVAKCIYFHNSVGGINWKREAMYYCKGQLGSSAELVSIPQSNELWTQVTDYVKNWMWVTKNPTFAITLVQQADCVKSFNECYVDLMEWL